MKSLTRWSKVVCWSALCAVMLCLWGCPPDEYEDDAGVYAFSGEPVSMTALVDHGDYSDEGPRNIYLSVGAALAVSGWHYCDQYSAPVSIVSADPATMGVKEIYQLNTYYGDNGKFVLTGLKAGTTTLRVDAPCVSKSYNVIIEPAATTFEDPSPSN